MAQSEPLRYAVITLNTKSVGQEFTTGGCPYKEAVDIPHGQGNIEVEVLPTFAKQT